MLPMSFLSITPTSIYGLYSLPACSIPANQNRTKITNPEKKNESYLGFNMYEKPNPNSNYIKTTKKLF